MTRLPARRLGDGRGRPRRRRCPSVDLVEESLRRIDEHDGEVNAFTFVLAE